MTAPIGLGEKITRIIRGEMDGSVERARDAAGSIMKLFKDAIENPHLDFEIDLWVARMMAGHRGKRAATQPGDKHVEYAPDPCIEIFARAYDTERRCGVVSGTATMCAM